MFENKNVVITGCNKGIGYKILEIFAQSKANIWACTRSHNESFIIDCKKIAEKNSVEIHNVYFDLKDNTSVTSGAKLILSQLKSVDVLINNAGSINTSLFLTSKIEDIIELFQVNFFSQLTLTQLLAKKMINKNRSSIINVSSIAGIDATEGRLAYSSTKSSMMIATKILAKEFARYNIRVNAIAPGLTDTDLMNESHSKDVVDKELDRIFLKRIAQPDEIAQLVLFLASDKSSYINGQTIRIDGGI